MLKGEWTTLLGMTLKACFLVRERLADHSGAGGHSPGRRERTMGVVAIRTPHKAFIHAMLEGHRKLSADVCVTAVAEVCLRLREQEFRLRRIMNRVAGCANDAAQSVTGTADVCSREALSVAANAGIQDLIRLGDPEGQDRQLARGLDMS